MNNLPLEYQIKLRKTRVGWNAHSPQLHARYKNAQFGEGATQQDAIASYLMLNANFYGVRSIYYDLMDKVTEAYVFENSISNTKIL